MLALSLLAFSLADTTDRQIGDVELENYESTLEIVQNYEGRWRDEHGNQLDVSMIDRQIRLVLTDQNGVSQHAGFGFDTRFHDCFMSGLSTSSVFPWETDWNSLADIEHEFYGDACVTIFAASENGQHHLTFSLFDNEGNPLPRSNAVIWGMDDQSQFTQSNMTDHFYAPTTNFVWQRAE